MSKYSLALEYEIKVVDSNNSLVMTSLATPTATFPYSYSLVVKRLLDLTYSMSHSKWFICGSSCIKLTTYFRSLPPLVTGGLLWSLCVGPSD